MAVDVRQERLTVLAPEAPARGRSGQSGVQVHCDRYKLVEELLGRGGEEVEEGEDGAGDLDLIPRLERLCLIDRLGVGPAAKVLQELLPEGEVEKVGEEGEEAGEAEEEGDGELPVVGEVEEDWSEGRLEQLLL